MDEHKITRKLIKPLKEAGHIALGYLIMSIIWIVFSDYIVLQFVLEDTLLFKNIQTLKGIVFVCVSSMIVFSIVYHRLKRLIQRTEELDKHIALIYAKLINKDYLEYYSKDTEEKIISNLELVDDMKKAIADNEFYLNYQIVLGLQEAKVEGVETLIRWIHPEKGNIPPLDFIPIAEQSNLIIEITEYVINTGLEQKRKWREEGYCINKISINISPNSMNTLGFCYYIEDKLREYGIKGEELILELTESTFIEDLQDMNINIKYLRNLGVEIALDDFGTGYSTLARLKDLNIDYIKLDRTFIMNMTRDSDDESLVRSVIEVSKILNIRVCAEGIETLEGLEILTEMGCTLGQGYLIHKPSEKLPLDFKYNICH